MANALPKDMTADEFLVWNLSQEERYELIDGVPVPLRGMAGASNFHDQVVINLIVALGNKLRGSGCMPRTADSALRVAIKRVRRPDVTVDCGASRPGSHESNKPTAVFEVLSPSTRTTDSGLKFYEYQHHPTLRTIVHIDPDVMDLVVYTRAEGADWLPLRLTQPTDTVAVAGTPAVLSLAEIYQDVPVAGASSV